MHYANALYSKSCKVANVHYKSTFIEPFIEGVDLSICHSPHKYWVTHPHSDVTNIVFKVQSLFKIRNEATKQANTNNQADLIKHTESVLEISHRPTQ